jgi:thymidine kinase
MAKLYFRYGVMTSSKTAQALMTRFNYLEKGRIVWLIKPSIDTRDGIDIIKSRIGIEAKAVIIDEKDNIEARMDEMNNQNDMLDGSYVPDVIIADEAQFFTKEQIDQLRTIASCRNIPVICFGLRTDFQSNMFPGSLRLMEVADSITEIKSICNCGEKAIINARIDINGKIITNGEQIEIGGNERYESMCWKCWQKKIKQRNNTEN